MNPYPDEISRPGGSYLHYMADRDRDPSSDTDRSEEHEGKFDKYIDRVLDLISLI